MSVEPTSGPGGPDEYALETLARQLTETVTAAGEIALAMFQSGVQSWTKGNNSPVTEADMAVDAFLHRHLMALDAGIGWLSEESADGPERLGVRRQWVVDPIDGTRGFMAGGHDWAVSAALVEEGRPILAALFAPASDELFTAVAGRGAMLNGRPLVVPDHRGLTGARVAGPPADMDAVARLAPVERLPRIRSLALRLARVATGEIDVALAAGNSNDWDLAAADLVVHEARGLLTSRAGAPLVYNAPEPRHPQLICAAPALHAALVEGLPQSPFFNATSGTQ